MVDSDLQFQALDIETEQYKLGNYNNVVDVDENDTKEASQPEIDSEEEEEEEKPKKRGKKKAQSNVNIQESESVGSEPDDFNFKEDDKNQAQPYTKYESQGRVRISINNE